MQATVKENSYVVLRLASDTLKIAQIVPKTLISCGKFGSFPAELLLGRPLFSTYEIHEDQATHAVRLRLVPASELNQEALVDTAPASADKDADPTGTSTPAEDAIPVVKDNRLTVDSPSRQTLTTEEIEALKRATTGSGREIIDKIMSAHTNLDEKTVYSLAKYALRKAKKFLRRFTVLPVDAGRLAQYVGLSKEASRILELREESLGLMTAWSNVHHTPELRPGQGGGGKWLVIDDTGGLVTAAVAEKMGLLHPVGGVESTAETNGDEDDQDAETTNADVDMPDAPTDSVKDATETNPHKRKRHASVATSNTIHVLHPASQPNLSLLKYFHHDVNQPTSNHPLSSHLLTLSWLQLLAPDRDPTYTEPEVVPQHELEAMKASRRSTYHRKRRRWQRCRHTVDSAREGEFDGLICATTMTSASLLKQLVPLIKGGGHVVMYSPTLEPLAQVVDLYSRDRKTAFIRLLDDWREQNGDQESANGDETPARKGGPDWKAQRLGTGHAPIDFVYDEQEFPVDPRLLLGCSVQTSRAREWQVLPGRTHPIMTAKGGGEGYVFTARRVLPYEGRVEARGKFTKKRKLAPA